jgi:hypothetical protein
MQGQESSYERKTDVNRKPIVYSGAIVNNPEALK